MSVNNCESNDSNIRPEALSDDVVSNLVYRLYGLTVTSHDELGSYVDRNYHVIVDDISCNPYISPPLIHKEYVLKILNSKESNEKNYAEGSNALMQHLHAEGVTCSLPQPNIIGKLSCFEKLPTPKSMENYIVRLYNFIPGIILHSEYLNAWLMQRTGQYVGKLDRVLQTFRHELYTSRASLWCLENVTKLTEYLHFIKDENRQKIARLVIEAFATEVVPVYDQLQKGVIHGDANCSNILIDYINGCRDVTAIIDIGDATWSCLVFELANLVMDVMLEKYELNEFDVGGHVLSGYLREIPLNNTELDVLKVCIASRFVQILVLGEYNLKLDPSNKHIARYVTADNWSLLERLWDCDRQDLYNEWFAIQPEY